MKTYTGIFRRVFYPLFFIITILTLGTFLNGCENKCTSTETYVYLTPVYTSMSELRDQVTILPAQPIESMGRLYIKGKYLFINEPGLGIHVIDNEDPSAPVTKSFISIPGNYDLAIMGNYLYADSYVDLVVFDLSNMESIQESGRIENAFHSYMAMGIGLGFGTGNQIVTSWEESEYVNASDCDQSRVYYNGGIIMNTFYDGIAVSAAMRESLTSPVGTNGPGIGGSTARFTINQNHLFVLDGGEVRSMSLEDESMPEPVGNVYVNWDIETIFPYKDKLFLGARTGMHIVDVSNPATPDLISTYAHINSCDPVVVDDHYAYVTLRSGNPTCEGFNNQLEVIDISDLTNPTLVATHAMFNPHGLGKDENLLFICDGNAGLKVFDAADVTKIGENLIATHSGINAYDVIAYNQHLMMIGADGIFQYSYSQPDDLVQLSKIEVSHED